MVYTCGNREKPSHRMLKKAVQQVKGRVVPSGYVEALNEARTLLAAFFSILLEDVRGEDLERAKPAAVPIPYRR